MIKAITFDLDGVYFTGDSFRSFKNSLPKGVTDEDKVNWVLYKSPQMFDFKKGKISEGDYWDFVKSELKVDLPNQEIFKLLRDSYHIDPDVQSFVKEVRASGITTCICSNNFETRIRELNSKFNFLEDFDVRIFSFEVGVMKPDKGIFEALVRSADVLPEEIIYSDDDESKLAGAKELGINCFVYEGFARFKEKITELTTTS